MTEEASASDLHAEAVALLPTAVRHRRRIHRHPEIGLDLPRTQALVAEELTRLGLAPSLGTGLSSVTALLVGGRPGPTIVLRADMDALPLSESTGVEFASEIDGAMHACGHDLHVAMLLTAAQLLVARRDQIPGRVLFMFQPGEEGYHGARFMLEEGLLGLKENGPSPSAAFAAHVTTRFPAGTVATRPGPIFASSDVFEIVLRGRGGHASRPHVALDPIPAAAELTLALGAMVPRRINPFDPGVVTVAHLVAGTTHNIIPDRALLQGTCRSLSEATRGTIRQEIHHIANAIADAHGLTADVDFESGYPATINDPGATDVVLSVAQAVLGTDDLHVMAEPTMAAEDFSYVLQQVPGAYFFVGACPTGSTPGATPDTHSNVVIFDEEAMAAGISMFAGLAIHGQDARDTPAGGS